MEGVIAIRAEIKRIEFSKGKIGFILKDGREIYMPVSFFPSIKKLSMAERKDWYVTDGEMFSFENCNEVFHLEQVLGKESSYSYKFP